MNNGVTNNNQSNSAGQTTLAPMAGVTIAPVSEQPVNASQSSQAAPIMITSQQAVPTNQPTQQVQVPSQPTITPLPAPEMQTQPTITQQPTPEVHQQSPPTTTINEQHPKKKKINFIIIFILIILGMIGYNFYTTNSYKNQIKQLNYNCTPVTTSKEEKELDLNSTLVKDLYKKVATNIREDIAEPEYNDSMRLYLAYRQILETEKTDSNCDGFSLSSMEPFTCQVSLNFVPKAFSVDTMKLAIKKLYGEKAEIPLGNIQLGNSCIVGYQYIPSRNEFVQGLCTQQNATSYNVEKKLTKATSTKNTIILTEEVKYHENEKMSLPDTLKSGTYYYKFRLDMNYNYVLVSKTYESKY